MHLKRPITYVLLLLAVVLAGDRGLSYVLDVLLLRSHSRYSRLYDGRAQADVVVIGNSRGVHSFHAPSMEKELGSTVVNLSYNALSAELAHVVLADYLERNGRPKLLVVEVSNIRVSPEVITELKPYTLHSERLTNVLKREQPTSYYATQVSHLFRLNGEMFFQNLRYLDGDDQNWILRHAMSQQLIDSVAQESDLPFPENMSLPPGLSEEEKSSKRQEYRELNMAALRAIVDLAQREGIDLRLVLAPYWPPFRHKITEWDDVVAQIQERAGPQTPIWDYSLALDDPGDFSDRVHPNLAGANKLLARMQSDGFFMEGAIPPPRRRE